jgi:hypothetical protein
MKKNLLLLTLILFFTSAYSQQNDTIFLKSGEIYTVYRVLDIEDGYLTFKRNKESNISTFDASLVKTIGFQPKQLRDATDAYDKAYMIEGSFYDKNKKLSESAYNDAWIQHNLNRFYTQKRCAQICYGLSLATSILYYTGSFDKELLYVSAGLSIAALAIDFHSYKWIKRASIKPSLQSLSLQLEF